jgi:hypothetical protein
MELRVKDVNEVYFATTVEYKIIYKGNDYTLRKYEDSRGSETLIFKDNEWQDLYEDSHGEIENELIELIWDGSLDEVTELDEDHALDIVLNQIADDLEEE